MSPFDIKRFLPVAKLHLHIGRRELCLKQGPRSETVLLSEPLGTGLPTQRHLASFENGLARVLAGASHGRQRMEITFSDALARCWIVERVSGLRNPAEVLALAETQLQDVYGDRPEDAAEWLLRVDVAPWAAGWPAMALPKAMLDVLLARIAERGWTLGRVQSDFVAAFNARRYRPFRSAGVDAHVLQTDDSLVIGIREGGQWLGLRSHPPQAILGCDLSAILRRDSLIAKRLPESCRLDVLPVALGRRNELRLDFSPVASPSPLRLGLGSAALALLVAFLWAGVGDIEAGLPQSLALLPDIEEVQAINVVIDDLDFPWVQVLGLLEASIDQNLRIRHFDADAREGRLTVNGEARSSQVVLELPARLRADSRVLEARVLSQSPVDSDTADDLPIRFTLEVILLARSYS